MIDNVVDGERGRLAIKGAPLRGAVVASRSRADSGGVVQSNRIIGGEVKLEVLVGVV